MDNAPMMSNSQVINHGPDKITIDFMGVYPQFNTKMQPTVVVNHKAIIMDPYTAKKFLEAFQENLQKYEKSFGVIEKPAQITQFEEVANSQVTSATSGARQSYVG